MKKALVLGGGGAKGSYQIGVWKALRKLKMSFDIVTGVSIGSINGAMYASGRYFIAQRMWKKLKTSDLFDLDLGGKDTNYFKVIKSLIKTGGMTFDKAENYLKKYIKEKRVRDSKIKYGLLTYSLSSKKAKSLPIDQIPEGKLVDYISASSICYPVVKKKDIDGEAFIDGGFYDGVPINLAIDMGAKEILAIDLSVLSINQQPKNKDVKIDVIKFNNKEPFTLSFNRKTAKKNIALGYNDTMKHFKKYDGNIYTFKKNSLEKNYKIMGKEYDNTLKSILNDFLYEKLKETKKLMKIMNSSVEYLGNAFELASEKVYDIKRYNLLVLANIKKLNKEKTTKKSKGKLLISYIFKKYNELNGSSLLKTMSGLYVLFPKEVLAVAYLVTIDKGIYNYGNN